MIVLLTLSTIYSGVLFLRLYQAVPNAVLFGDIGEAAAGPMVTFPLHWSSIAKSPQLWFCLGCGSLIPCIELTDSSESVFDELVLIVGLGFVSYRCEASN